MGGQRGFVIEETAVPAAREDGDTATVRLTIDESSGSERLEQRVLRFAPGRSRERAHADAQEVLYVVAGTGTVLLDGTPHELEPETAVCLLPGERHAVENPGPDELVLVAVRAPASTRAESGDRRVTVRYADQPILPAGKDREFRYLVDATSGCPEVTQFVGTIPPGRAPMHSHTYDEVIYVLEGTGRIHFEGRNAPIAAGSCIHLPPLLMHCLENAGPGPMRVLGVFHPAGDPASRAAEGLE
jgi:quercetin dioxygenase-like cupin family protein